MTDPAPAPAETHHAEEVLWTGRRSHWFYLGYGLLGFVVAAGLAVGLRYYHERFQPAWWHEWVYAATALPLLVAAIAVALARGNRRYRITNRRVISEAGRVVRDSNEIRIQDIRSINVLKRGFSGLLGIGKVEFSSAATDDADVIFHEIGGADTVRDMVRRLQS